MLETIHEYAHEKLEESGEGEEMGRQHALYFLRFAEEAEAQLKGRNQIEWLDRLDEEHDNLRAALSWAARSSNSQNREIGLRLAAALGWFWYVRGHLTEGRNHLAAAWAATQTTHPGVRSLDRASALTQAGRLAWRQGDYAEARTLVEQGLEIYRQLEVDSSEHIRGLADALITRSLLYGAAGDDTLRQSLLEQTVALCRKAAYRSGEAACLYQLGVLSIAKGDIEKARAQYEQGLAIQREIGDKRGMALSLNNLGILLSLQGDIVPAGALYEESLAIMRDLDDRWGIAAALNNLGTVAREQGDFSTARALHGEGLAIMRELGDRSDLAIALNNLGTVAYMQGDYSMACSLYAESLSIIYTLGHQLIIAVSLSGVGASAAGLGQVERGARLLGATEELLETAGDVLYAQDRILYEQGVTYARAQLGEEAFERLRSEGRALTLDQAIAYALEVTPGG
jgi:tetratricopeptide (TPR) repeat protein